MRKTLALGIMAALAIGGAAWADHAGNWDPSLDQKILIGTVGPISDGQFQVFEFQLDDNPYPVIGFSFSGDYVIQPP